MRTIIRSVYSSWPLLLLIGLPFFFVGGPGFYSTRSVVHLWDLGHVLFFAIFTLWLQRLLPLQPRKRASAQSLAILFFLPFLAGFVVECLQFAANGRSPSIADMLRNQLGVIIALAFQGWPQYQTKIHRHALVLLRGLALALLVVALLPFLTAVWDEQQARRQFPLLADFESPYELSRWYYWKQLRLEHQIVRHGNSSARVQLSTAKYSGIALFHFPRDWRGYRKLHFSVYNPLATRLLLNCRLDDTVHRQRHGPYEDRFNTQFSLKPGWNDLSVSLQQAAAAPKGRAMNMARIKGFGLFVVEQKEALAIYLDHVYLE
ncbi:MAG: hypothetical protein Q4G66_09265 [bacterium]|nr:hypothetical protein [bacterium]